MNWIVFFVGQICFVFCVSCDSVITIVPLALPTLETQNITEIIFLIEFNDELCAVECKRLFNFANSGN